MAHLWGGAPHCQAGLGPVSGQSHVALHPHPCPFPARRRGGLRQRRNTLALEILSER